MSKEFTTKVNGALQSASLNAFNECITSSLSDLDVNVAINKVCENIRKISGIKDYVKVLASRYPKQLFSSFKEILFSLQDNQEQFVEKELLLEHEHNYANAIIDLLRIAFFYSENKTEFIKKCDSVSFTNDQILGEIDNLEFLSDFLQKKETDLRPAYVKINSWTWNLVLLSLCIKIEEYYPINGAIRNVIEKIINNKDTGCLKGNYDEIHADYFVLISSLIHKTNDKVKFAGNDLSATELAQNYAQFERYFNVYLDYVQACTLVEQYCLQGNLLMELNENEANFKFKSIDFENRFRNDGIKYQVENNFWHQQNNIEGIQKYHIDSDSAFNHYMQENIQKTITRLIDYGIIRKQKGDSNEIKDKVLFNNQLVNVFTLVSFPIVQATRGISRFRHLMDSINENDYLLKLYQCLIANVSVGIEKGFPFELYDRNELPKFFSKTLVQQSITDETMVDVDNIVEGFTFNKNGNTSQPFTFNKYTYLQIGDKCFSFRSVLASNEPSLIILNRILSEANAIGEERNQDSDLVEQYFNNLFESKGFATQKLKGKIPQTDLLAYKNGVLIVGELKLTGFRDSLGNNMIFIHRQLSKAAIQLDIRLDFIENNPSEIAKILSTPQNPITEKMVSAAEKKTLIITNSYEFDHQYIGRHLKISLFEIVGILKNIKQNLPLTYLSIVPNYPEILTAKSINALFSETDILTQKPMEQMRLENLSQKWKLYEEDEIQSKRVIELIYNNVFWDILDEIKSIEITNPYKIKDKTILYAHLEDEDLKSTYSKYIGFLNKLNSIRPMQ